MSSTFTTVLLLLLATLLHRASAACHPNDRAGLLAFKAGITQDPSGILKSWVPATDCCSWDGVSCGENSRVDTLTIYAQTYEPNSYLTGTLSSGLSKLRYMRGLYLKDLQNITGPFPTFLSTIPKLRYIYIDNNKLSGPIPSDIGTRFAKLEALGLSENWLTGGIPSSVGQLTHLTQLVLPGNQLTGPIPDGIRHLKNLTYLNLAKNQLSGKIKIGNFAELIALDLSANQLTGIVPSTLSSLTELHNLNLGGNNLVGPFPKMNFEWIETLDLSYNTFKLGQIPKWASSSFMVYSLKLAGCGLKFKLDNFKPTGNVHEYIDLSDNKISGSPIALLKHTTMLKEFVASDNKLRFNISELVIPGSLRYLNLSRNKVYGEIPASIVGLEKLDLSHNRLCGEIPNNKFPAKVFKGNNCLCGFPLRACKK